MCGIVAYHGAGTDPALPVLLDGLSRLEYRGYDSVGVALTSAVGEPPTVYRAVGRLPELVAQLPVAGDDSAIGIAHTRWATHGAPTEVNAHPHRDCTGRIALVHNGTLNNASALRAQLTAAGHVIATEVDSELIAHLIEDQLDLVADAGTPVDDPYRLVSAVGSAVRDLRGSWALAVTAQGVDGVVLARHRSPLVVGEAPGLRMAASDQLGLAPPIETVRELADGDLVLLASHTTWFDAHAQPVSHPTPWVVTARHAPVELGGAADFTAKEIDEQPAAAAHLIDTVTGRLDRGRLLTDLGLPRPSRVRLVACGSSSYAAQVITYTLALGGIPSRVVTASEHAADVPESDTLTIALSQSGETADVLAALETWADPVLAITNNPQSTLARRADAVLGLGCGPEIGVAATKSFTAQVIAGSALALSMASAHGRLTTGKLTELEDLLAGVPARLAATHAQVADPATALATSLAHHTGWIYVSRGAGVPYACEGALKLKELAYRWVEAVPAGELKHGPLALVQPGTPVVLVQAQPAEKLAVNATEIFARGAHIITVGAGEDAALPISTPNVEPPWGPLEAVIALQHLARAVSRELGHDVDRPRNLAKSVTVE